MNYEHMVKKYSKWITSYFMINKSHVLTNFTEEGSQLELWVVHVVPRMLCSLRSNHGGKVYPK